MEEKSQTLHQKNRLGVLKIRLDPVGDPGCKLNLYERKGLEKMESSGTLLEAIACRSIFTAVVINMREADAAVV